MACTTPCIVVDQCGPAPAASYITLCNLMVKKQTTCTNDNVAFACCTNTQINKVTPFPVTPAPTATLVDHCCEIDEADTGLMTSQLLTTWQLDIPFNDAVGTTRHAETIITVTFTDVFSSCSIKDCNVISGTASFDTPFSVDPTTGTIITGTVDLSITVQACLVQKELKVLAEALCPDQGLCVVTP